MKPSIHLQPRGAALIVALFFLVLISIVTLGFLGNSRVERGAASSHFERMRAATLARDGVESIVAILRRETTDPQRNWISQPGALIVPAAPPADPKQLRKQVPLSSGAPSDAFLATEDALLDLEPPELNVQTLTDQNPATYLITDRRDATTGAPAQMKLRWIHVRKDGTHDLEPATGLPVETPVRTNKANPIAGRFAYWADDESSKINYNIAWKRNTASTPAAKSNTAPAAHPSRINLMALTLSTGAALPEKMADALHNWTAVSPGRFFNSFADARLVEAQQPGVSAMLAFNKFELTHFNHDPDTTFFGEDRILLTMNRKLVPKNADGTYARKFLDILRDDLTDPDPGILEHIAGGQPDWTNANGNPSKAPLLPNKLDAAVRMLMDYISRKNWPLSPGVSFKDKYYPTSLDSDGRLGQIAVNIIDYVRAKESPAQVIAPLRFAINTNAADAINWDSTNNRGRFTLNPSQTYGVANSYQGICRAPYITEMGFWTEPDPSDPPTSPAPSGWPKDASNNPVKLYRCFFKTELFLPPNYGFQAGGIDLVPDLAVKPLTTSTGWFITATETRDPKAAKYRYRSPNGQMVLMEGHGTNAVRIFKGDVQGGEGPNGTVLNPGKHVVITATFYRDKKWADRKTLATRGALYKGLTGSDGLLAGDLNRWPRVNIGTQVGNISYLTSDPAITPIENMISIEVDDPRCNVHPKDWIPNKSGKNTFGTVNSVSTVGLAPTKSPPGKPQQDTDVNGKVSDYSLYMPPPKGVGTNDATHDNGRVTSIAELGYIHTGNEGKGNDLTLSSIPWRTIRLQPNNYPDSKTLPDWAFMDLFAAPSVGATGPTAIFTPHGTSVGGRINVNSHVDPFPKLVRNRGLVALLAGSGNLPPATTAETIAENIYRRTLASGTNKGKVFGYPWTASPLETDPNAFDTPGEICEIKGVADTGEKSEELVRDVASLITARGNVFSIYTVGQALKQTPNGRFIVTAEQRQHAVVERYLDNRGTPDATDDEVRFRTLYFRNLTP